VHGDVVYGDALEAVIATCVDAVYCGVRAAVEQCGNQPLPTSRLPGMAEVDLRQEDLPLLVAHPMPDGVCGQPGCKGLVTMEHLVLRGDEVRQVGIDVAAARHGATFRPTPLDRCGATESVDMWPQ